MTFYVAAMTLILVMDPLGNIPVFLSVLKRFDQRKQFMIICREVFIAFIILLLFLFFGKYIMHGLQLSTDALSISGGIILFLIAIRMIFPNNNAMASFDDTDPFIVPLAVPLTAGPSALATVLLFVTQNPGHLMMWFWAVVFATVVFFIIVSAGNLLIRCLGERGLVAIERLMGMILTTVAVQMFLTGLRHYFAS